jgi:hypothetical protein
MMWLRNSSRSAASDFTSTPRGRSVGDELEQAAIRVPEVNAHPFALGAEPRHGTGLNFNTVCSKMGDRTLDRARPDKAEITVPWPHRKAGPERIEMSVREYEHIRSGGTRFFVAPADEHVLPDVEAVVERLNRYWLVGALSTALPAAGAHTSQSTIRSRPTAGMRARSSSANYTSTSLGRQTSRAIPRFARGSTRSPSKRMASFTASAYPRSRFNNQGCFSLPDMDALIDAAGLRFRGPAQRRVQRGWPFAVSSSRRVWGRDGRSRIAVP